VERVPPSEKTRAELRTLLTQGTGGDPKSELVRLSVRRVLEETLEAAVRDLLGREYYERRDEDAEGHRNGHREGRLRTSEGEVRYAVPQVRGTSSEPIAALRATLSGKTEELERLAVEMFARGCSYRDIEETFRGADGRSLLSRTALTEVTEALWKEYEEFATRDLSELRPLYLFVDGIAERLRVGAPREAVLAAWAITWDGAKVLVHMAPGTKESTECCREFFQEMKRRGLTDPVLMATDGAPGMIRAAEECFPTTLRQRCLAHRMRNILAKLPEEAIDEFRQAATAAYQAPSPAMARALRGDLVERFGKEYPAAVACFEEDFEACIAQLHCPPGHRRVIRTTNLLERLFREERRRLGAAGTLMGGERVVLKLMFASVIRAADRWRGIRISEFERRQLEKLRDQLVTDHRQRHAPVVTTINTPSHISSKKRT
jgi:transposase-like protein